jgi:Ala-tRNA(Pro) deacylase
MNSDIKQKEESIMPVHKLKEFLDNHHINYVCMTCSPAYTAQEVAASAHVSGKYMAKTVIVKAGDKLVMVVLPAQDHINFGVLKTALQAKEADLATESEFKTQFPECEAGAMPPFGNLYGMAVYVSNHLSEHDQIVFNAGTHSEVMRLAYADFEKLVHPNVIKM